MSARNEDESIDFVKKFDPEKIGVAKHALRIPDRPALIMNDTVVTYRELDRKGNALAEGLLKAGVKPGDRIAILMHNCPEMLIIWNAAGKISVGPISINYRFKEDEIAYIVNDSESKALIYGEEFEQVVDKTKSKLDSGCSIFICSGRRAEGGALQLEELMTPGSDAPPKIESGSYTVAPSLIYTSGTTGRPKGVFRNSKNRLNTLLGYAYNFEATYDDVDLVAGPLYHAAPFAWAAFSLVLGNTVVIMPRFDPEEFLRLVEKYKVTTVWVVPTMLNRIMNLPPETRNRYDVSSIRVMTVGGESFPFALKKKAIEYFGDGKIFEFYGGTEISCVTFLRPEDQLRKPGSCGKPAIGNEIKLLDENKHEVPVGEVGVMYVKSPFLLDGYFKNPKATQESYHNGYFTVGDMARVDEEGYYYIVDRAVDMIISGGVNIYPAEIEEVLYTHPDVYDVAVIGAPDPEWGEKIVAYVVLKEDARVKEKDIIEFVAEKLASYKKPKEVIFVKQIPYLPSGKKLKRVLKEQYLENLGRS